MQKKYHDADLMKALGLDLLRSGHTPSVRKVRIWSRCWSIEIAFLECGIVDGSAGWLGKEEEGVGEMVEVKESAFDK